MKRSAYAPKEQKRPFSVGGVEFCTNKKVAGYKLATIKEAEDIKKYYVKYKGRKLPVKQALNAVEPRLMRAGFNTTEAISVFRKLGFELGED